jgi:hypothetical protein
MRTLLIYTGNIYLGHFLIIIQSEVNFILETQNKLSTIIGDGSQTKGETCMGGIGKGQETYNLNVVDVLTVE